MGNDSVPAGDEIYTLGRGNCIGVGYEVSLAQTQQALSGEVAEKHHSVAEREALMEELDAIAQTGFEADELKATLASFALVEPWRIGETFADCWLSANRNCIFPWDTRLDHRTLKASLPGTDSVGLSRINGDILFAFNETKTSSHEQSPPSVMKGNKSPQYQLIKLIDSKEQRRQLVQNLGVH